jgi:hypothetical protein
LLHPGKGGLDVIVPCKIAAAQHGASCRSPPNHVTHVCAIASDDDASREAPDALRVVGHIVRCQ